MTLATIRGNPFGCHWKISASALIVHEPDPGQLESGFPSGTAPSGTVPTRTMDQQVIESSARILTSLRGDAAGYC